MPPTCDLLIVGGGPAALAAARAYRESGGEGAVVLASDDTHPPYDRPPLSKDFLRGDTGLDELFMEPPEFYRDHGIDLRLRTTVEAIDPRAGLARLGAEELGWRRLVLATGSRPLPLPVPGGDHPDVLLLRRVADSERIRALAGPGTRVAVLGSGFIGCEVAASLAMRGAEVTLVARDSAPQRNRLGEEAGRRIAGWLEALGVRLRMDTKVERIEDARTVVAGEPIRADVVVAGGGIAPRGELASAAGLAVDEGRVVADERMRTTARGVYVAGDAAFARNAAAGRPLVVEHWGEADRMGEIAGTNAAGGAAVWDEVPGFWSQIGEHTLKYAAWGDGYDRAEVKTGPGPDDFTVSYSRDGRPAGVLTSGRDADYERGRDLIGRG
jgi:NADPH-dependent 2,4-dienoyl-CoA reductase/sulfur reductase-like enzyme